MDRSKFLSNFWQYVKLSFGTLLFCFSWTSFAIPNNFTSGGVTGLSTIIQFATGGAIPMDVSYAVMNAVLLIVGFIILGKGFGFKTIYCIILATVLLRVLPKFEVLQSVEGNFLYIPDTVLIPIVAGILEAIGVGIIFVNGGSTGGSDILALAINKYWPVPLSKFYLVTDVLIISSIALIPGKVLADMIYGYIMMVVFSTMLDFVLVGRQSSVQMMVFSSKYNEIADYILHDLKRGVTALRGIGWYTQSERQILLIIMKKKQLHEITPVIKSIDPKAFISISPASSVYGEGFEQIKTGIKIKSKSS